MVTQQPDEILEKLVVHVVGAEVFQVKDDAQCVDDFLVALVARQLLVHTKRYGPGNKCFRKPPPNVWQITFK